MVMYYNMNRCILFIYVQYPHAGSHIMLIHVTGTKMKGDDIIMN